MNLQSCPSFLLRDENIGVYHHIQLSCLILRDLIHLLCLVAHTEIKRFLPILAISHILPIILSLLSWTQSHSLGSIFYSYILCQFSLSCPLYGHLKYMLSPLQWFVLSCPILSLISFHSNQSLCCQNIHSCPN